MKILKGLPLSLQLVILLLVLLSSSSSSLFSANLFLPKSEIANYPHDFNSISNLGEEVNNLFHSILPTQKNVFFIEGNFTAFEDIKRYKLFHAGASKDYVKRSRFIIPGLGVKEIIFPFHVFL